MKVWKIIKITVLMFIVFTLIAIFVRSGVKYIKISDRKINTTYVFPDSIQQELNVIAPFIIHEKINDAVCSYLKYGMKNEINKGRANCIGYAHLYANSYNEFIKLSGDYPNTYARVVDGYVEWYGINLNKVLMKLVPERWKGWVSNTTFIELNHNGHKYYCSPCISDLPFPFFLFDGFDINASIDLMFCGAIFSTLVYCFVLLFKRLIRNYIKAKKDFMNLNKEQR